MSTLDGEILELTADDTLTEEIDRADQYKEEVRRVLAKLNKALHSTYAPTPRTNLSPRVDSVPVEPTAGSSTTTNPQVGAPDITGVHPTPLAHGTKVKLPKFTLPRFNGNPVKWTAFWDSYESSIHNNGELSEVDKFNYFRSLLEGSAFEAVQSLTLSAANYLDAISILKKRFGNRQLIVSNTW